MADTKMLVVRDWEGRPVVVYALDFFEAARENSVALFGLTFDLVLQLYKQYERRGGHIPVTKESIEEVFGDPHEMVIRPLREPKKEKNNGTV